MKEHPFWVITARCDNGNNGWKVWIVCVQTTHDDALRVHRVLTDQAQQFLERSAPISTERVERAQRWHARYPLPNEQPTPPEAQQEWDDDVDWPLQQLRDLVESIGMIDRRYPWATRFVYTCEAPEYAIVETSDDPHTFPVEDDYF